MSRAGLKGLLLACAGLLSTAPALPAATDSTAFKSGQFDPARTAPDFSLSSSNGGTLAINQYRGKVVLLAFGYSSCTAVCPISLATYAMARRRMGAAAADVQVVYITVDPQRDVPSHLHDFLQAFDKSFVGGTGSEAQLAAVRKQYGISAEKVAAGNDYAYSHSSFTYLIDRAGRIRSLMPYGHSAADYVNDLSLLLKE